MHCSSSRTKSAATAAHPPSFLPPCYWASRVAPHAPRGACVITRASLYDLLGVASSASTVEIRTAFRRLAARYHPDQNSSLLAHEKFQALNLAAEVLTSELRQAYDSRGTAALPSSRYSSLLDFLKQAARGQGLSSVLGEPGADLSTVLGMDFSEAVTGSAATVTLDVLGPCGDCKGSGMEASTQTAACRVCKGSGEIIVRQWSPDSSSSRDGSSGSSMVTLPRSCPGCRGTGKSEQQDCKRCDGEGRVQLRRKVRFKVPGGVVDGQVLRVKGQGHSGKYGGAPGDLLVKLQVYDLADVRRHGYDLHSVLSLTLYDALLGGSVPVKTVRGHRNILVPAGVQHGQLLCVQGAGVPRPGLNGVEYGHHYFEVSVQVPSAAAASEVEMQLLQRLAAAVQQQPGRVHHGLRRQQQQQQQQQDVTQHQHRQPPQQVSPQQPQQRQPQQHRAEQPGVDRQRAAATAAAAACAQDGQQRQQSQANPAAAAAAVGAGPSQHTDGGQDPYG